MPDLVVSEEQRLALTSINGYLEVLGDTVPPDAGREFLTRIRATPTG